MKKSEFLATRGWSLPARKSSFSSLLLWGACSVIAAGISVAEPMQDPTVSMESQFLSPPNSARPRVWWHWMNGNVTQDGIKKDLEWMHRVGIGGLQNFDAAIETPQIVNQRLVYMTSAWRDAFRYTAKLADELNLELAIASSAGWSQTGGPWVKPADAMKKLVWSETEVVGGHRFHEKLAALPTTTGPFQDISIRDAMPGTQAHASPKLAADVVVLAIPLESSPDKLQPSHAMANDGSALDVATLFDGRYEQSISVAKGTADKPGFITVEFARPQTVRSLTISMPGSAMMFMGTDLAPRLEVTDQAGNWRKVIDIALRPVPTTVSFDPVRGQRFRLLLLPSSQPPMSLGEPAPGAIAGFPSFFAAGQAQLSELRLGSAPVVNEFEVKAGFFVDIDRGGKNAGDFYALDEHTGAEVRGADPRRIVNLTSQLAADGTLDWTPPPGRWKVLRLGWSLIGKMNHPATPEATGLEVDKYDADAVRRYLDTYLGMYEEFLGPELMGKHGLRALLNDSIEVGASNWTPRMIDQFRTRRGYDPTLWLPTLTGVIVGSRQQSDAFLRDFRQTLSELIASEHYGTIANGARQRGLTVYSEALEGFRPGFGEDMAMRSHADVPMAALWTYGRNGPTKTSLADLKGASSIAHLNGRTFVATESLTSAFAPWANAPRDLKPVIDRIFASGINRPVIHTSVHQPLDDKQPGLSLQIFGQFFNRHETWAEMARPWMDYLSRSSYLLQQGRNVADVAYFYGEDRPLTAEYGDAMPANAPTRYAYDFINADSLLRSIRVEDGDLVSTGGARYRLLYLGGSSEHMSVAMLRRIASLAEQGAVVVGLAPKHSIRLNDDPQEFGRLIKKLWSGNAVTLVGKGRVIHGTDIEAALATIGATFDLDTSVPAAQSAMAFVHRRIDDGDIYYLANLSADAQAIDADFRVNGKLPELWRADTGGMEQVSYRIESGRTIVPLQFDAHDAYFIVFRKPAVASSAAIAKPKLEAMSDIGGVWDVSFQPGRGAPAAARLPLGSLAANDDPGIRYFSGVATYRTQFTLPSGVKTNEPLWIDLGSVGDVAEVRVNGKLLGTVWKAPYQVDIASAVHKGSNQLEVRVATLWVNRLIGDVQPDAKKIAYVTIPTYKPDAPLRPSGLIGPVRLLKEKRN